MSVDFREQILLTMSNAFIVSVESVACLMSYTGSVWPVVNSSICALSSCVISFFSLSWGVYGNVDKIKHCFFGCLFLITSMFYCSAAIDFYSCETDPASNVNVYDSTDQCSKIAKDDLRNSCAVFISGFACLVISYTIDIVKEVRRRSLVAYAVFV